MLRGTAAKDSARSIAVALNTANIAARKAGVAEPAPGYGAEGHWTRYSVQARFGASLS
jgi:hypothetical protein